MEAAKNGLERITTAAENLAFISEKSPVKEMTAEETEKVKETDAFVKKFEDAMEDDFNTADAVSAVFELVKFTNTEVKDDSSAEFAEKVLSVLKTLTDILGLIVVKEKESDAEIDALIEERQAARKAKNFARADEIRDELKARGIVLEDTKDGVKWKKIQ